MKTLREKIKAIVYHESDMDKIMVLIQKEVKECLPKERILNEDNPQYVLGWNACFYYIHMKLFGKGLI